MNKIVKVIAIAMLLCVNQQVFGQWVVTDPVNLAQGIINSANEIVQTSQTVNNVVKNFKEVEKLYNQGKDYYQKLERVNGLVKDAKKVQQTVLLVAEVSSMYVNNFSKMVNDSNFSPNEILAIGNGYSILLSQSTDLLKELKLIVNQSSLSLNDKQRMDVVDKVYEKIKEHHSLVSYYTRKNISVSLLRAKKYNSQKRVLDLYGSSDQKYW